MPQNVGNIFDHVFDTLSRIYTGLLTLFDLTSFGTNNALKANVLLPQSGLALECRSGICCFVWVAVGEVFFWKVCLKV